MQMKYCQRTFFWNLWILQESNFNISLKHKFSINRESVIHTYMSYRCSVNGCSWFLSVACDDNRAFTRVIRFNDAHSHNAQDMSDMKMIVHTKHLGEMIVKRIIKTLSYTPTKIRNDFQNALNVTSHTYNHGQRKRGEAHYRGKTRRWLCYGSFVDLDCENRQNKFKILFIAYEPSIKGFQFCWPILSIDGCFLTRNYKGNLLSATWYDADNGLYPLAHAIVSLENDDDWHRFLMKLKVILIDRIVTIVTDCHSSLISGVRRIFGMTAYAWCLRHLMENFTSYINSHIVILKMKGKKRIQRRSYRIVLLT